MTPNQDDIKKLWQLYLQDQASPDQVEKLFRFISDPANDEVNLGYYRELSGDVLLSGEPADTSRANAVFGAVLDQNGELKALLGGMNNDKPVVKLTATRRPWFRIAAAAALVVTLAGTAIYLFMNEHTPANQLTEISTKDSALVLPGTQKALLTLADGSTILLDSAGDGHLASQGNAEIVKSGNGRLTYTAGSATGAALIWNKMSTPRGGQYQLSLPDGTKVWLNAASSIRFPVSFVEKERKVMVEGEAYFEVAANKEKPFRVEVMNGPTVEVLGTHFNLNSYRDEGEVKTTLLQGAVSVTDQQNKILLKPGQQAIAAQGGLSLNTGADLQQVLAWKNGTFNFNNTSIAQVMKQLERWYDIDVKYAGAIPEIRLKGEMDRGVKLIDVQRFLSSYGIDNKLENRVLTISSK